MLLLTTSVLAQTKPDNWTAHEETEYQQAVADTAASHSFPNPAIGQFLNDPNTGRQWWRVHWKEIELGRHHPLGVNVRMGPPPIPSAEALGMKPPQH